MILYMIKYMISCSEQICVALLACYPNNPNLVESFDVKTNIDLQGGSLVLYASGNLDNRIYKDK